MAAVRDPTFWRRFSLAVHLDDKEKALRAHPELKHTYVSSLSSPCTSTGPTSPCNWPSSPPTYHGYLPDPTNEKAQDGFQKDDGARGASLKDFDFQPPAAAPPTRPKPSRQPTRLSKKPPFQTYTTMHRNPSQLTLGLSGRPPSRFKFWTSISANGLTSDSWLEAQLRKKRQRTWMCWAFWLVFFALVAGVVIAILLLKARHII
ncbi:hypothetical protein CC78DRAFT_185442 [Lojkania enalia]|uniref:Uncharacterized protein n=1 Tax=Lojkania enalia TaxID=147567 RepID=A0A9P4KB81_9PLEO|nr:hypothetical protein CC78DRAFT_185442 [Didymosphaeria enalia]